VDYDTYAEGEAVLGWLNAQIDLATTGAGADWSVFVSSLMRGLQDAFGVTIRTLRSLRPGRPVPTYRYSAAVQP
jgi:hypothetical protein